jgi:hypothetical protein
MDNMMYLRLFNGYASVVGEDDHWDVAYELTGDTAMLFGAAQAMLTTLRDLRREIRAGSILDSGNIEAWGKEIDAVLAKAEGREAEEEKVIEMLCCICSSPILVVNGWRDGHNAQPVMDGRCCGHCNQNHVIPARLAEFANRKKGGK